MHEEILGIIRVNFVSIVIVTVYHISNGLSTSGGSRVLVGTVRECVERRAHARLG